MHNWIIVIALIFILLFLDLGVFNKTDHAIGIKKSLYLTAFYLFVALFFGLWIGYHIGPRSMHEYYTGYLVEKSLSLDNLFVMSVIFKYLSIPRQYQHRVLFWGILGVIILRGIMIGLGGLLITRFEWMLYVFSIFLVLMGIKMLFLEQAETDIAQNPVLKFLRRHCRLSAEINSANFLTLKNNKIWLTPLFVALILIETADLVFAIDSIPAIFAITQNTYIVYTSNIFAILGLRSLYFCLDAVMARFIYLQTALACILIFIGSKIFIAHGLGLEKFPAMVSLSITMILLILGIGLSLIKTRRHH